MPIFDNADFLKILLAILFAIVSITVGLWVNRVRKTRNRAEASKTAQALGLNFFEEDNFGLVPQLKAFEMFRHSRRRFGRKGRVANILRGQVGDTEVFQFDYTYMVSTGKSTRRISQTVFFANDKQWSLPDFRLCPEQWWHQILTKIGVANDIEFPENPDFSKRFYLTSKLEELAHQKFGPEMQKFLLGGPRIHLEGSNYYLIAYQPRKLLRGEEARQFYTRCCQLTALLKGIEKQDLLDLAELKNSEAASPAVIQNSAEKRTQ